MDTLKTISQSVNEVDQMEPIFYGVLLFSSVSVFIMLICIFCCWQQNQLEDYSFVEQLNQRLIDSDRSLLNYPRSHEKAAAGQPNSMVRSPRPTYKTVNRDRFKQTTLKAIYEPPFNPSTQGGGNLVQFYRYSPQSPDGQNCPPTRLVDPESSPSSYMNNKGSAAIRPESPNTSRANSSQPTESDFPGNVMSMLKRTATGTDASKKKKALTEHSSKVVLAQEEDISRKKVDKRLVAALRLKKLDRLAEKEDEKI